MLRSKTKTGFIGKGIFLISLVCLTLTSCSSDDVGKIWGKLNELVGISWELKSYGRLGEEQALIAGSEITIEFESDNQLNGFSGCNTYFGGYNADDDGNMTISDTGSTTKYCGTPEGVDKQEADYLYLLSVVANYEINSDGLHLFYDNKQSALHFKIK